MLHAVLGIMQKPWKRNSKVETYVPNYLEVIIWDQFGTLGDWWWISGKQEIFEFTRISLQANSSATIPQRIRRSSLLFLRSWLCEKPETFFFNSWDDCIRNPVVDEPEETIFFASYNNLLGHYTPVHWKINGWNSQSSRGHFVEVAVWQKKDFRKLSRNDSLLCGQVLTYIEEDMKKKEFFLTSKCAWTSSQFDITSKE